MRAACHGNGERLLTAADEVGGLLTALNGTTAADAGGIDRALGALLDLLLELPQTRLLAAEMFGGVRLHPSGQPSADEVARALRIVRNIFIQAASKRARGRRRTGDAVPRRTRHGRQRRR